MKKILLVLDGDVAEDFLQNLLARGNIHNSYLVVAKQKGIEERLPILEQENFHVYYFDPTSPSKLLPLLSKTVTDAFIVMQDKKEVREVYAILRQYSSRILITLLGDHSYCVDDKYMNLITETPLITSHLMAKIPNIPLISKDIGLGSGEIMQISIPFGSSFAYRTIGSIMQKNWKIVALYRKGKMMLAKYSIVMEPNDSLLVAGDPNILLDVYRRIKEELGQFPFPFGRNVLLYCDCCHEKIQETNASIQEALYLHKKFKDRKLHIRILNPATPQMIANLRALEKEGIEVSVQYHKRSLIELLEEDKKVFGAGLVLMREHLFASSKVRGLLYRLNLPVLRLGVGSFEKMQGCSVLVGDQVRQNDKIASVAFDIASQLKLPLILYDFAPDLQWHHESIDHYESMSKVFDTKLEVITTAMENSLVWLMRHPEILGVFPFTEEMTGRRFANPFTTNLGRLSLSFIASHKLFIPISND